MAIVVLAVASILCALLFLYPYLLYPLLLGLAPRQPVHPAPVDLRPSLLFCAHNEAESLPAKLDNLRQLKVGHPGLEVLAYDDGSSDGTFELLSGASDLLTLVRGPGRTGKAAGMKRLAAMASGDVLVFTDANVLLAPDAIAKLLPYYGDPSVGGLCGQLRYLDEDGASATAQVGSAYWRLDERLRSLESATGNVMGADGSIFSVRRDLYPTFPDSVLDDLTVSMSVLFQGKRLIKAADVVAFERSVSDRREELRRKMRIGARAYHTHLYLRDQLRRMSWLDRFKYFSRKQLRWFGGIFLALALLFALAALSLASAPAALLALLVAAAAAGASRLSSGGALARAWQIVEAIFATLAGVLQGMRGKTATTWAPAKSR